MVQLPDVTRGEDSCEEDTEDDARPSLERMTGPETKTVASSGAQRSPVTSVSAASSGGGGMSRSVSDTTLRKHALHLNLSQSVLPSFTPLHQFKVWVRETIIT